MSANAATLKIAIEVDDRGSVKIKNLGRVSEDAGQQGEKGFGRMRKSLNDLDTSSKVTLGTFTNIGLAATAMAATAAAAVTAVMVKAINKASELAETTSKFNTVFAGQLESANAMAAGLVDGYAMSNREAKQYLSSVQDLLVPMGMQSDAAAKMSNEVVKLSADLGSFNNLPTAQVMDDMQSALVGNYETMKKYGVVLNATNVQEKALAMGLAATKDELTAAHKAQAAYQLIVEGSTAAIGDMSRTADGYANQLKENTAITEDLTASLGQRLLPVAADVLKQINEAMRGGTNGVDGLSEAISVKLLSALGWALETIRFFHNGWLGLKLVGTGAVAAIAASLELLFAGLRKVMVGWDLMFEALVKLGVMKNNPLDAISEKLGDFAETSADVTKDVLQDIDKTNASYDKIKAAIEGYKKEVQSVPPVVKDAAKVIVTENERSTEKIIKHSKDQLEAFEKSAAGITDNWVLMEQDRKDVSERSSQAILDLKYQEAEEAYALKEREAARERALQDETTQYMADRFKEAYDGIQDTLAEWLKTGEFNFDSLLDMWKNMLAEMVAAWIMSMAKMEIASWFGKGDGVGWGSMFDGLFGNSSSSSGSGGMSSWTSLIGAAYEKWAGKSFTASLSDWGSSLFTSGSTAYSGTGSLAAGGAGMGAAYGGGAVYAGTGSLAAGGGLAGSAGTGVAWGTTGSSLGAGGAWGGTAAGGGTAATAGGGSSALAGAGTTALAAAPWIGTAILAARAWFGPDNTKADRLFNDAGVRPDNFRGLGNDQFYDVVSPADGHIMKAMSNLIGNVVTSWGDMNNGIMETQTLIFNNATGMWEELRLNAGATFALMSHQVISETDAMAMEMETGISGLAQQMISASENIQTGFDKAREEMLLLGVGSGELVKAMELAHNAAESASGSTDELVAHLHRLGLSEDQISRVTGHLTSEMLNAAGPSGLLAQSLNNFSGTAYDLSMILGDIPAGLDDMTSSLMQMGEVVNSGGFSVAGMSIPGLTMPDGTTTPSVPEPTGTGGGGGGAGGYGPGFIVGPGPTYMADGGYLSRATIIGGEDGPEVVAPVHLGRNTLKVMHDDILSVAGGLRGIIDAIGGMKIEIIIDEPDLLPAGKINSRIRVVSEKAIAAKVGRGHALDKLVYS